MKKLFIFLFIGFFLSVIATGKTHRRVLSIFESSVPETETLAKETMEFVYDYRYSVDTTNVLKENIASDNMLLQIGPDGLSKFSSYRNLTVDSLIMNATREQIAEAAMDGKLSTGEFMTIFKNYPDGKLTHTEKICQDWFRYDEEMPALEWELTDSTVNILGYECKGARCNFRGREWNAFYTEDIPLMDGPWKLHGLPGLIMCASDKNGEYTFECIGIKSKADRPITIYKVPFNKTDRKKYYDTKHRYEINPYGYYEATTGGHITVTDQAGNPALDAYEPSELLYDYLELDWKK
ncbi:MAG: GLPGLI family protein [Muribaculaceae bacterium]|nr:GLPGLI family protein [Muribaculaceae bacterium]MDE6753802.1 GLPGLI family protein [Muribaculaceae bacterium]